MYFNVSRRMFGKGCTNMACEHMKGVAMAHDVTKQVTIEKQMSMVQLLLQ
jgi:hypothetical protein